MMLSLQDIGAVLAGKDAGATGSEARHPLLDRLARARAGLLAASPTTGAADLVVLVRQCLENYRLNHCGTLHAQATVLVPAGPPWPDQRDWELASLQAVVAPFGHHCYRLTLAPWLPNWMDASGQQGLADSCAGRPCDDARAEPADEVVQEVSGHRFAASAGQRHAIRSVFLAPPGSTVLAVLPTGSGKSLVFQFAAMHNAARDGTVIVIVPTVALARDQERRYRELVDRRVDHAGGEPSPATPLAFHSGLEPTARAEFWSALRGGNLPIAFLSPEAALGSQFEALREAARLGRISLFAVDEAHVVAQWGDHFRSVFQALGGLRNALLAECGPEHRFRTVLLTATLTPSTYDVLKSVFSRGSHAEPSAEPLVVSQVWLRPEPRYIIHHCDGPPAEAEAAKVARITEALRHLPRPLILYTTTRGDADVWHNRCQDLGFRRVRRVIGGDMSAPGAETLLDAWKNRDIDMIVATSAFGLGVDQAEVRSIVHACLPENVDRWYQEVGRGGRDGCASVALMVTTRRDSEIAERMADEVLAGNDIAHLRWKAMFHGAISRNPDGTFTLPLSAVRAAKAGTAHNISVDSELNQAWNYRIITMMARAKMLEIAPPPDGGAQVADAAPSFTVETLLGNLDDLHVFSAPFEAQRERQRLQNEQDACAVIDLQHGRRSPTDLLLEAYRIEGIVEPAQSRDGAVVRHPLRSLNGLKPRLARIMDQFAPAGRLWVTYSPRETGHIGWPERLRRLLTQLAAMGVVEFELPEQLPPARWLELAASSSNRYVFRSSGIANWRWSVPAFTCLASPVSDRQVADIERRRCQPHIVLVPTDAPHWTPNRTLVSMVESLLPLAHFEERLVDG